MSEDTFGDCLVFGGCGWTGSFLVATLTRLKDSLKISSVHSADIRVSDACFQELHDGVIYHNCDISNRADVRRVVSAVNPTVVFHLASMIDLRVHPSPQIAQVNVGGTENIIEALKSLTPQRRRYLVYTSTIDVVSGTWGVSDADEYSPYADKEPSNDYKKTKIMAEKIVLQSDCDALRTVALRPGHIFGPGDPILEHILKSPVGLGTSRSLMSFVYVQNCAFCHVLAAAALVKEAGTVELKSETIRGTSFFVTDIDTNFSDMYCALGGQREVSIRIPWWVTLIIVIGAEALEHIVFYLFGTSLQHPVTGISRGILEACGDLTARSSRARRVLHYCENKGYFLPSKKSDSTIDHIELQRSISTTRFCHETGKIIFL